jgi:2-oxoglutarate ferredoxin oxidoreductase subunit gamma
MTTEQTVFAGFGGQGILSMGKFLAYAGMEADLNVSWLPSYGPEMRGGTANCSVILTDEAIGSPIVTQATSAVVMNRPSLDKFEPALQPGGVLIIDDDLISRPVQRTDIDVIRIAAQTVAERIGNKKAANIILLGALVEKTQVVSRDILLQSIYNHGKKEFFEINQEALAKGAEFVSTAAR